MIKDKGIEKKWREPLSRSCMNVNEQIYIQILVYDTINNSSVSNLCLHHSNKIYHLSKDFSFNIIH